MMTQYEIEKILSQLPAVDALLKQPSLMELEISVSRSMVKQAVQSVLASARQELLQGMREDVPALPELEKRIKQTLRDRNRFHLRRVINATGTILHTNLGRSILSTSLQRHLLSVSCHYSNLEYDLVDGKRGSRYSHLTDILKELTGAEDVLVVNNNAAAVLLVLDTLVHGKNVAISRGELVEIGGFFRIPDVIKRSGGKILEVGTTNKTHLEDYVQAFNMDLIGAIMKVHTSNYRIIGFTESVPAEALAELAHLNRVPLINDLGSGLFIDMRRFGLPYEPTVREAIEQGCDVVTFSGDKLLGGPQAGIIVGKEKYIEQMKKNQLLRALRIDKMTLAALEATLRLYLDEERAIRQIPVLQMLALTAEECKTRAERLAEIVQQQNPFLKTAVMPDQDIVGGGAYPEYVLPGYVVTVESPTMTASVLEENLRLEPSPIITRVQKDQVCLSVRTLYEDEYPVIAQALQHVLKTD
jgi:L-seryl-tRNA(Ser) seleniumtransferase